jgi:hypothetical protein
VRREMSTHCPRPPANFLFTSVIHHQDYKSDDQERGRTGIGSRCISYSCFNVSSSLAVSSHSSALRIHVW